MTSWTNFALSDIIEINNFPKAQKGEEYKHIGMPDLDGYDRKVKSTSKKEYTYSKPRAKNRDTIVGKMVHSLRTGKIAFIDVLDEEEIATTSTEFYILRPKDEGRILPKFIYYTMRRKDIVKKAIKWTNGTTANRERFPKDFFDYTEINLPPLEEQRRIVGLLDAIDSKIELNREISSLLEETAQSIYNSWFQAYETYEEFKQTEIGEIPDDFEVKELGEVIRMKNGEETEGEESGKYKIYGANGEIGNYRDYNEEDAVIVGRVGSIGEIHRLNQKAWVSDNSIICKSESPNINNEFLYFTLKSIDLKKMNRGAANPLIAQSDIGDTLISLPEEESGKKFSEISSTIRMKIDNLESENDYLEELRDYLLPRLLSGEVVVGEEFLED